MVYTILSLYNYLAASRNCGVVVVVCGINTEATARKGIPEKALVSTSESVDISLDPCIASSQD